MNCRLRSFSVLGLYSLILLSSRPSPASDQSAAARQPTPERVLHFSDDYSLGNLYIEDEQHDHTVKAVNLWVRNEDWQYHARAQGDVTIPAGHRAKLQLGRAVWQNRKRADDLAKLPADAIYTLSFLPPKQEIGSDWLIPHICCLAGLKELDLGSITVSGKSLEPLSQCLDLQLLWAPPEFSNRGIKAISGIQSLKSVFLLGQDNQFTDKSLGLLKSMPQLEELLISGPELTDQALIQISELKGLKRLYLSGPFSNGALVHLKELPKLKILRIQIDQFSDDGMRIISGIPTLERFCSYSLPSTTKLTDEGIGFLRNLPNVTMLELHSAALTDASLTILGQMTNLTYLNLPYGFTDAGVEKLAGLKNLTYLRVNTASCSMLTDRSMETISTLSQLEELRIGGKSITDKGVSCLSQLKQLRALGICKSHITDHGLETISRMQGLENLSLRPECSLTTDGLNRLNQLACLKTISINKIKKGKADLNLSGLKKLDYVCLVMDSTYHRESQQRSFLSLLDNEDLKCFEGTARLHFFCISGTQIDNAGFKTIAGLPKLQVLQLFGPTRMTDQAFAAFSPDSPIATIHLRSGHFTGDCLEHFVKLENLWGLKLTSDNAFDSKSIHAFKQKKKIYYLDLKP